MSSLVKGRGNVINEKHHIFVRHEKKAEKNSGDSSSFTPLDIRYKKKVRREAEKREVAPFLVIVYINLSFAGWFHLYKVCWSFKTGERMVFPF